MTTAPVEHAPQNADTETVATGKPPQKKKRQKPLPENQTLKGRIEAVLFMTNVALEVEELAETVGANFDEVEMALVELIQDYGFRDDCALEIDDTDGYILQVKADYGDMIHAMVPVDLSPGMIRTLAAIALRAPIRQTELVELRGSSAYEHIQELAKLKFISRRRQGRSYVLNVTDTFHEYFKLAGDKQDLERIMQQLEISQAVKDMDETYTAAEKSARAEADASE